MKSMTDERFIANIVPIEGALDKVMALVPVEYSSMQVDEAGRRYGVTAQSVMKNVPAAGEQDGMGNLYCDPELLVPVLVKAVQELKAEVERLQRKRKAPEA